MLQAKWIPKEEWLLIISSQLYRVIDQYNASFFRGNRILCWNRYLLSFTSDSYSRKACISCYQKWLVDLDYGFVWLFESDLRCLPSICSSAPSDCSIQQTVDWLYLPSIFQTTLPWNHLSWNPLAEKEWTCWQFHAIFSRRCSFWLSVRLWYSFDCISLCFSASIQV